MKKDNYSSYVISMFKLYTRYISQNKPVSDYTNVERLDIQAVEKGLTRLKKENKSDVLAAVKYIYLDTDSHTVKALHAREICYCTNNEIDIRELNKLLAFARKIIAEYRVLRMEYKR